MGKVYSTKQQKIDWLIEHRDLWWDGVLTNDRLMTIWSKMYAANLYSSRYSFLTFSETFLNTYLREATRQLTLKTKKKKIAAKEIDYNSSQLPEGEEIDPNFTPAKQRTIAVVKTLEKKVGRSSGFGATKDGVVYVGGGSSFYTAQEKANQHLSVLINSALKSSPAVQVAFEPTTEKMDPDKVNAAYKTVLLRKANKFKRNNFLRKIVRQYRYKPHGMSDKVVAAVEKCIEQEEEFFCNTSNLSS